jgi:hypothetical protein
MDWSIPIDCGLPRPADGAIRRRLVAIYCGLVRADQVPEHWLLLLRFLLVNLIALGLLGGAVAGGWVGQLLAADDAGYLRLIAAVFVVGLVLATQRAVQLSRSLDDLGRFAAVQGAPPSTLRQMQGRDAASRSLLVAALRLRLGGQIAPIRHLVNSLVLLGLIGTVIGFVVALSGVRPEAAADVDAITPRVATLVEGMSIALHTTLVGSLLHLWLMVDVRVLESGAVRLLATTIEVGERHAEL